VLYRGDDIGALASEPLRKLRSKLQIIFQDPYASLNPKMRIGAILDEALATHGLHPGKGRPRPACRRAAGAGGPARRACEPLSARVLGRPAPAHRRRARARVEPEFIVADEPLSALDVSIQSQVINLLAELRERLSLTMLFISHDLDVVEYLCDRVVVLYLGKVMEVAQTDALFEQPLHPYTRALLAASPKPDPTQPSTHVALTGDIPSPMAAPSGCVFRTRCPHAIEACAEHVPALEEVEPGRWVACIRKEIVWMKAAA
jgi:peptide/nickel transport system ATP-binding protein